jgi:hypothetical protein
MSEKRLNDRISDEGERTVFTTKTTIGMLAAASIALTSVGPAFSQEFDLSWHTFDAGGGLVIGGDYELVGTIAQPDAGAPMTGGGFELLGGFWPGALSPASCLGDLDGDGAISVSDLTILLSNFGSTSAAPESGDLDGDGDVDIGDLSLLLSLFGSLCP